MNTGESAQPQPDYRSLALAAAREDLGAYCCLMMKQFDRAPHIDVLLSKLEAVAAGQIKRLALFLPPRHSKSTTASTALPAWFLGKHPERYVISASYGQDLADDFGRKVRHLMSDPLHRAVFPDCEIAAESSSMRRFDLTAGGTYFAVGRGAAITGRGADLLIIDDPLKDAEEARSETIRRALHEWYSHVAYTRLQPGGAIVLIQTRWHLDDLAGRVLREAHDQWEVVSFPAIAERDEPFRKAGEALWPERFPLQALEAIRANVGGSAWSALYQQNPVAAEGAIFQRKWWRFYRDGDEPDCFQRVISLDSAFKTGAHNDYSVATVWGQARNGYYLLGMWRQRVEFPALKAVICALAKEWKAHVLLVEDKASGQSLIQVLQSETPLAVVPVKVDSDKETRAHAVSAMVEAGKVFLPEQVPWLADYMQELSEFPAGPHDDCVDSTTQALAYLREHCYGVAEYYAQEQAKLAQPNATTAPGDPDAPQCSHCGAASVIKVKDRGMEFAVWRCLKCRSQRPAEGVVA